MVVEGERIKALVERAKTEVVLCAPFIKEKVFATLLNVIPTGVSVRVVTRWKPAEVAAGLSDLEVFDVANERPKTQLYLLNALHAKLYVADGECLVGSANLTATALGWCPDSNLEVLIPAKRSDPDITLLLERLAHAIPATFQIRAEVEKAAAGLEKPIFDESQDILPEMFESIISPWLPRCAAPEKLFQIYGDSEMKLAIENTKDDALADLQDLAPVSGLDEEAFRHYIRNALWQIPSIQNILEKIPAGMTDAQGKEIVQGLRQDLPLADVTKQWSIIRDWIDVFFKDQFEVAAQSYVVRLKSR